MGARGCLGPIFGRPGACTDPPGTMPPCFAPGSLHQAGLRLLSRRTCARSYPRALDSTMLCSRDRTGPAARACSGDSGSPLAVRNGGSWVQVGVISWGAEVKRRRCDDTDLPNRERIPAGAIRHAGHEALHGGHRRPYSCGPTPQKT